MYLDRLRRFDPLLGCVVTLCERRALEQARRADDAIAAGRYRGPLHGIPWGAKDLLSVKGYPTTWGAAPFARQVIDEDATVVRRLDEAGAVLVAKLTLGELATGVWFGAKPATRGIRARARPAPRRAGGGGCRWARGLRSAPETRGSILSPHALRRDRTAADVRPGQPARCDGIGLEHGQVGADLPGRGGLCAGAGSGRRSRRPRRDGGARCAVRLGRHPRRSGAARGIPAVSSTVTPMPWTRNGGCTTGPPSRPCASSA